MADRRSRKAESRPSFLARWVRRLATLAIVLAIALFAGFRIQHDRWAWEDPAGFRGYALEWWRLTKETGDAAAGAVKKKADEAGITAATEELIERARRTLAGEPATPEPAPAAEPGTHEAATTAVAAPAGAPSGAPKPAGADALPELRPAAPKPQGRVPDGYYEAFKAGYEAYREGLVHFSAAKPRTPAEQKELRAAKASFEKARDRWNEAAALYDRDAKLESLQRELNQFLLDCNKRLKPM